MPGPARKALYQVRSLCFERPTRFAQLTLGMRQMADGVQMLIGYTRWNLDLSAAHGR
jgi:hypothetical protein